MPKLLLRSSYIMFLHIHLHKPFIHPIYPILLFVVCSGFVSQAQHKKISLEDIWMHHTFNIQHPEAVWLSKNTITRWVQQDSTWKIQKYTYPFDKVSGTLLSSTQLENKWSSIRMDSYILLQEGRWVLISYDEQSLFRHSSKSRWVALNTKTMKATPIAHGLQISNLCADPTHTRLAYTCDNNMYIQHLQDFKLDTLTRDGRPGHIINGASDWVYEEEFEITRAYEWSADGQKVYYLKFDESQVPEYTLTLYNGLYPKHITYKYPKAGEKNSNVSLHVYDLPSCRTSEIYRSTHQEYIPRIFTHPHQGDVVFYYTLNRTQDTLRIWNSHTTQDLRPVVVYQETNPYYIEIGRTPLFIDNRRWVFESESSGYRHLYLYDYQSSSLLPLTSGPWEVSATLGYYSPRKELYFSSKSASVLETHIYKVSLTNPSQPKRLTTLPGVHGIEINKWGNIGAYSFSDPSSVQYGWYDFDKDQMKIDLPNQEFSQALKDHGIGKPIYYTFTTSSGVPLHAYNIYPAGFDSTKRYPVLVFLYGGPGSQEVLRQYDGNLYLWHQMLAQLGYIVACTDNRGTGGRGQEFKKCTTGKLGAFESEDQIAFAGYLRSLPFVDSTRIGIWGWSYGGYLATLSHFISEGLYKLAIAVAPVIQWRWYDTIYTERFLKLPLQNSEGYDRYSPLTHAHKLKGRYLLVHGTADDNVHVQHSMELQKELIRKGKDFDCFYYPDKNHSLGGVSTRMHLFEKMTRYILENL